MPRGSSVGSVLCHVDFSLLVLSLTSNSCDALAVTEIENLNVMAARWQLTNKIEGSVLLIRFVLFIALE